MDRRDEMPFYPKAAVVLSKELAISHMTSRTKDPILSHSRKRIDQRHAELECYRQIVKQTMKQKKVSVKH